MLRLVKMDLHRYHRGPLWKMTLFTLLYVLAIVLLQAQAISNGADSQVSAGSSDDVHVAVGLDNGSEAFLKTGMTLSSFVTANGLGAGTVLIWMVPLLIFMNADLNRGFRKNVANLTLWRGNIAVSKFIVGIVATGEFLAIYYMSSFIVGKIVLGSWLSLGSIPELIGNFALQWVLVSAYIIFALSINLMSSSLYPGLIVGILFIMGVGSLVSLGLNLAAAQVAPHLGLDFSTFMLDGYLTHNVAQSSVPVALAVACVWAVVWSVIATFVVNRTDVK